MSRRKVREPELNSSRQAFMKAFSSSSSGWLKSPSSSSSRRHCSKVRPQKSRHADRSSSAGLEPFPRWRFGTASPGSRFSFSTSFCSSSTRAAAAAYKEAGSSKGCQRRVAVVTSCSARIAAARSVREPLAEKPLMRGKPRLSSSDVEEVPPGAGSFRFRRCMVAPMSAKARTRRPLPSKTGRFCTACLTAFCSSPTAASVAQFGRGCCLSRSAARAETAFADVIFSALEMFSSKAEASSLQIALWCLSTPPDVVGQSSLQRGSQPVFTSWSLDHRNPKAFAAIEAFSSGSSAPSSQRRQTSQRARAKETLKALRCASSVLNSASFCSSRSETTRVSSWGVFRLAKLAKQDAAAFLTSRFWSNSAPAQHLSMDVATWPPVGTAEGRSAQIAIHKSQAPTRVFAPTPRAKESLVLGASAAAFSSVTSGTSCRINFMDSESLELETRAASSSRPFEASAASIWNCQYCRAVFSIMESDTNSGGIKSCTYAESKFVLWASLIISRMMSKHRGWAWVYLSQVVSSKGINVLIAASTSVVLLSLVSQSLKVRFLIILIKGFTTACTRSSMSSISRMAMLHKSSKMKLMSDQTLPLNKACAACTAASRVATLPLPRAATRFRAI
mmetsp:Transcript_84699/g.177137  ORF Transcript_84699/g.177137 Transcript_84699/m.177137 type:complete len:618 (+) Transcript_84699:408-2261(+)